jgi:signal transduction histidine kinase
MEPDPVKRSPVVRRRFIVGSLSCGLVILVLLAARAYIHSAVRGLPYRDSFSKGKADEWKALGGTWELANGMMRNNSDERGAKLISGSPYWRNYSIEADVSLLGVSGDAGLILRSGNEEEGVNAYSGYYAGVRTLDGALVLGRADHSWMEAPQRVVPSGIRPFQWYHLKLLAYDCQLAVAVTALSSGTRTSFGVTDSDCIRSGRIGLRSYSSGGVWQNVVVRPATNKDLVATLNGDGNLQNTHSEPLIQDDDVLNSNRLLQQEQALEGSAATARSIASLRLTSFAQPAAVTVRGVVILTSPRLYIQDSTGGAYVNNPSAPPLKVGDEVEIRGEVHPQDFSSTLERATVRVLWARTPVPPVSVTASQASTGKYDATFIEVRGRLAGKERGPGNSLILDLDEGPQSFQAILNPGRSDYLFTQLKPDSSLRLRGICVVDPALTHSLTPFVLLLRSNEDLDIIAGPPWWNTGHIIAIVAATLILALIAVSLYHRVENWRLRAILEERERLAHEMHDTLAQSFAGIGFQLQAIRNGLALDMTTVHQQLELASNLVRHSHEEARRSIATLRSEDLQSEDVLLALDRCARRMVEGGEVQVRSQKEGDQRALPLRTLDTLYRIGQEAIANAVRHGEPTLVAVRLTYGNNSISLEIEDNGKGFNTGGNHLGFGIRGMRRRAQGIYSSLKIDSTPGTGTRVRIEAPLPPRVTLFSWTRLVCKYAMEQWINVRAAMHPHSNSYRG